MSIERRLERLEARAGVPPVGDEGAMTQEVLSRLSVDELRSYVNALRRMKAGEEPVEEDRPILERVEELREEVTNEH